MVFVLFVWVDACNLDEGGLGDDLRLAVGVCVDVPGVTVLSLL